MPGSVRLHNLTDIPMIWKIYKGVTVRKTDPCIEKWIQERTEDIGGMYSGKGWGDSPIFSGYTALHDQYSEKKGILSSSKNTIRFILEKGRVFRVNTFVDIYNTVSALTGISIGAHDTDKISGDPRLEFIGKDTPFRIIGKNREEVAKKGEYGYADDSGILCRMDIKQSYRSRVTEATRDVLVIFQGHSRMGEPVLNQGMQLLDEAVNALLGHCPDPVGS